MSVFARLIKEAKKSELGKPQNVYEEGRSVRFAKPLTEDEIRPELKKYAGDRDYRVYNDYLRFGREKAFETAVERKAFKENKDLHNYYYDLEFNNPDTDATNLLFKTAKDAVNKYIQDEWDDKTHSKLLYAIEELYNAGEIKDVPMGMGKDTAPIFLQDLEKAHGAYLSTFKPIQGENNARSIVNKIAEKDIYAIDKALRAMPENMEVLDGTVKRGLHFDSEDARTSFLNSVLKGEWKDPSSGKTYWKDPAFHSVTTDRRTADGFTNRHGEHGVVIDYDTSQRLPNMTFNTGESESIYPPDTWFEVVNSEAAFDEFPARLTLRPLYNNPRAEALQNKLSPNDVDHLMEKRIAQENRKYTRFMDRKHIVDKDKLNPGYLAHLHANALDDKTSLDDLIYQYNQYPNKQDVGYDLETFASKVLGITPKPNFNMAWFDMA